ncbi:hypothetical protein AVEN_235448-1 [Araneus ventricosus]|uniref:Uncharacterized protein n=1 Tax=Araneus ventricosus TaxID=182803 RepID=A0A4Y2A523_ARAVE|nr:hypothetical protein AVEN_235448-1 [Araneus ventricosus]
MQAQYHHDEDVIPTPLTIRCGLSEGPQFFSSMDPPLWLLQIGGGQEADCERQTFVTPGKLYEFKVIRFYNAYISRPSRE